MEFKINSYSSVTNPWCFFPNYFFLKSSFRFTGKLRRRYRNFPNLPDPHIHGLPHYEHPSLPHTRAVPLLEVKNLQWTSHISHLSPQTTSGFSLGVKTFYGFGKIYTDMYLPSWYHTGYFHCRKHPPVHHFLPSNSWQPLIFFIVSTVLPFPECHTAGIRKLAFLVALRHSFKSRWGAQYPM